MKPFNLRKLFTFAALGLAAVSHSAATTLTVTNTNDSGAGSLRQAIATAAVTGDVIVFAPGVTGTVTLTSGELFLTKSLTINGPGATNLTISGNNTSRVFSVSSGVITLSGLRIANGFVTGNPNALLAGAGILNNSARLTVQNCEIVNNVQMGGPTTSFPVTGQGGGIFHISGGDAITGGRLLLQNCLFSGNMAIGGSGADAVTTNSAGADAAPAQGAALFVYPSSANSVTIKDCTFINNSAIGGTGGNGNGTGTRGRGGRGQGGAVYVGENTVLVAERSTFRNNHAIGGVRGAGSNTTDSNPADGQGGAVYDAGVTLMYDCTLDGNDATGGAGINATGLVGGPGQGGGLYFAGGFVALTRNTVINNLAEGGAGGTGGSTSRGEGGGLFIRYSGNQFTMNVNNSTVALNIANGGNAASGGGIWTEDILNLINSTVAFNIVLSDASGTGGGMRINGGTTSLRNTLVAKNVFDAAPSDASGAVASSSTHNLIGVGTGPGTTITGIAHGVSNNLVGTSGTPIDPKMHAPLPNGGLTKTCSIDADSPAVNAGNDTNAPVVDQRGYVRSGVSDIGAFEFGGSVPFLQILSIKRLANGTNLLTGLGVPNSIHRVRASADLSPGSFFDLPTTVTADGAGLWQYQDAGTNQPKKFYRLAFP